MLGTVVNSFPFFQLDHKRFYGVLQRIAVCYLAVSLLYLWDSRAWLLVTGLVFTLVGYWVQVRWVPVPGAGVPGRDVPFMDVRQNLVSWIDRQQLRWSPGRAISRSSRLARGVAQRPLHIRR